MSVRGMNTKATLIILSAPPFPSRPEGCRDKGAFPRARCALAWGCGRSLSASLREAGPAHKAANSSDVGGCLRDSQLMIMPPQERGSTGNSV